ncbi:hypothetical protein D3C84_725020 [compost metagenome]
MYGMIAFVLYGLFVALRWPLEKRAKARREQAEAAAKRDAEEALVDESFAANSSDRYRNPPEAPLGGNRSRVEPRL